MTSNVPIAQAQIENLVGSTLYYLTHCGAPTLGLSSLDFGKDIQNIFCSRIRSKSILATVCSHTPLASKEPARMCGGSDPEPDGRAAQLRTIGALQGPIWNPRNGPLRFAVIEEILDLVSRPDRVVR
jgi:hypothetical protein